MSDTQTMSPEVAAYLHALDAANHATESPVSIQPVSGGSQGPNWAAIQNLVNQGYKANPDGTMTAPNGDVLAGSTGGSWNTVLRSASASPKPQSAPSTDFATQANLLFPYLPAPLRQVFVDAWSQYGDMNLALQTMRESPLYEQYYAGNRRSDGTLRMDEATYASTMEGYDRTLSSFGLNPANYAQQKIAALQHGTSPNELQSNIGKMYVGIVTKADSYQAYYAQKYGNGNISTTALLDSALDGTISPYESERRIQAAQIGGAAGLYGIDLAKQEADRLQSFGLTDQAAQQLFSKAKTELPTLNALQQRFGDPSDPLTPEHYADAVVLNSPEEMQMIGRLYSQDKAQYSSGGTFAPTSEFGAQRGLLAR